MIQDTGAKMIHIGKNTRSSIISKSIATNGGTCNYRGLIKITSQASESFSEVICDSLILDDKSKSDTIPNESIYNNTSFIKHEAKVSEMDKEILFYLNSRGIEEKEAKHLFSLGFIQPFIKELPLEYAVELNRLLKTII
jgi:Fe-S cluster assembly protein SufB